MGRNICCRIASRRLVAVALHVRAWVEIIEDIEASIDAVVALHVRAWVEMTLSNGSCRKRKVALHVRAWVEIPGQIQCVVDQLVALHVRAWVEIARMKVEIL